MPAPTVETVEERILDNIKTTLADISPASGSADFWTTVRAVHRMDRDPIEVAANELPAVVVTYDELEPYYDFTDCVSHNLKATVFCIAPRESATWQRDIGRFSADVQRAVRVDPGRGSVSGQANAFDTEVLRAVVANHAADFPVAMARVDLLVKYRHLHNDPTVSI